MTTRYRMTPEDAGVPNWSPGDWRELESEEDETLLHPAHTVFNASPLLRSLTDPQMRVERQAGGIWEPASWRHLDPREQSRRGDRALRLNQLRGALRTAESTTAFAAATIDAERQAVERANEEIKAAPKRLKAAEAVKVTADAKEREIREQLHELTQPAAV